MLMLASKVASHCTVLRSENWAFGRLSRSHTITMTFIPNNLVGQVNVSCTTEVNFQRLAVLMWLQRNNNTRKLSRIGVVMRERPCPCLLVHYTVSWQLLHSRPTTPGANDVSELALEAAHHRLAVA